MALEIADAELIAEFAIESQEGLANIEQQMLAIEADGAEINTELVNAVFRTMHSIKGTAGFLGLDRIGSLAHGLEDVLNRLRNRELVPSSELVTNVLLGADFIKGLIDHVETSNQADIAPYLAKLQQFRQSADAESAPTNTPPAKAATTAETLDLPTLSEATREFITECYENLEVMDSDLLTLEQNPQADNLIRGIFRTMHTLKGGAGFLGLRTLEKLAHAAEGLLGKLRDGHLALNANRVGVLFAAVEKCRAGLQLLEARGSDTGLDCGNVIERLWVAEREQEPMGSRLGDQLIAQGSAKQEDVEAALDQQAQGDPMRLGEILVEQGVVTTNDVRAAINSLKSGTAPAANSPSNATSDSGNAEKNPSSAADTTIRVDVALLDKLMTRVGELVLARNQILQYTNGSNDAEFVSTAQRLNLITTELQEGVMKTRMQPIGNVWAKFPRVVRDLSSQLGKQVRIELEGKETDLDKTILEAIKDPLTHLIRNSVDHGIESPAVRRSTGKPEEGCLLLRAYHEGGQVNIEITDDGAGLNLERIRKKGIEKGLVTADQAARMSDREAAQLILLPGFSTAEKVTNVSGRGVGMDVVKTNIEKIGGTLDLHSNPGQGTTVKIKIPLTLAIIPALIVTTGGDRYAIPQVSLLELVRLEAEEVPQKIEYVHGAPVYRLRGKLLPLVNLSERLSLNTSNDVPHSRTADRAVNIVVLRANDRQYGLVVDKVNDTEEIVVKPLSRQLKCLGEYAGTTIMGDGTVALILDVMGLALASGLAAEARDSNGVSNKGDASTSQETQTLLVVDLGDTRRFALPTSMVARLEKVSTASLEYADGREVIQYRGDILPIIRLTDVFGAPEQSGNAPTELQIVVYAEQDHHCGFVVNRILDIVETQLQLHTKNGVNENLLGTSVIQQHVTDVLNLRHLARHQTR
jgi:two-component system chemotaxis sensor kinase CheA